MLKILLELMPFGFSKLTELEGWRPGGRLVSHDHMRLWEGKCSCDLDASTIAPVRGPECVE